FNQIGEVSGRLRLGDAWLDVDRWWGCRDHSWGVRPSMGVPEPVTGASTPPAQTGSLFCFLFFSTDTLAGHMQVAERSTTRTYLTGLLRDRRDAASPDLIVDDAQLALRFFDGTRRVQQLGMELTLVDGRSLT